MEAWLNETDSIGRCQIKLEKIFLKQAKGKKPRGKVKVTAGKMVPSIKLQKGTAQIDRNENMSYTVRSQGNWS